MMIALFLAIYVVILPDQEKAELLGEESYPGTFIGSENIGSPKLAFRPLLSDSPGLVKPYLQDVYQKNLASVNLFSLADQQYDTVTNNLHLESSTFSSDKAKYSFSLDNFEDLRDLKLLFFVVSSEGEMTIKLNGAKILSGEITSEMLPVVLPRSLLGETNELEFEVERPSLFQFVSSNEYLLKDVVLIKEYLVQNNYEARQFVLDEEDLRDLNHMSLLFRLNCMTYNEEGRIKVLLNGILVHDSLAVCDAGVTEVDFSPSDLVIGRNVLEFFVDKGQYVLENPVVESDYSQKEFYKSYFTLNPNDVMDILNGADVMLEAGFFNDGLLKSGVFIVNGYPVEFSTSRGDFVTDLNGLVYEGQNVITVVPDTVFEIVTLDIFLA